jgi:hypothetical protein
MRDNSPYEELSIDCGNNHMDDPGNCAICGADIQSGELCAECDKLQERLAYWEVECRRHAKHCTACCIPIIDDEGNPGYISEACQRGAEILANYQELDKEILDKANKKYFERLRVCSRCGLEMESGVSGGKSDCCGFPIVPYTFNQSKKRR